MNDAVLPAPGASDIETFGHDGYVFVRGLFDAARMRRRSRERRRACRLARSAERYMMYFGRNVLYITCNRRSEGDHLARDYADKRRSYPRECEREPGKQYVFRV